MRRTLAKLALSAAFVAGGAMAAQACPYKNVQAKGSLSADSFQLAQAGGGSGGSGGASGGSSGASSGNTGGSGSGSGTGAGPVIPQNEPLRDPATPATPGTSSGQTGSTVTNPNSTTTNR